MSLTWRWYCSRETLLDNKSPLCINSPVMRCGKSKLIEIIDKLAWNSSGSTVIASSATLFRMAAKGCTFLADEVESLKNSDREQFGAIMTILNAGFSPAVTVPRMEKGKGGKLELKKFEVFGPKVLAGISTVSDTIKDRSLLIRMTRKASGERVERLNMRVEKPAFDKLRASMTAWAEQNAGAVEKIYESLPAEGWRVGEMKTLEWRDVDLAGKIVRLRPEISKNKDGRVLPLGSELLEVFERAKRQQRLDCRRVFHLNGAPIGDFRKAWKTACKAAGLKGTLVHDLRRTSIRNMVRAGVPERVAMTLSGHKTRNVFDRYNIVSEEDLAQATRKLDSHLASQPQTAQVSVLEKAL